MLYATSADHFGNGTLAYAEAYGINLKEQSGYKTAQAAAARLLGNVIVLKRIDELLSDGPMTDEEADKLLAFWMRQKINPQTAVAAIKEYNALQQRILKRIEVKTADPVGAALDKLGLGEQMDAGKATDTSGTPS